MTVELDKDGNIKWEKVSPKVRKIYNRIMKLTETSPAAASILIDVIIHSGKEEKS